MDFQRNQGFFRAFCLMILFCFNQEGKNLAPDSEGPSDYHRGVSFFQNGQYDLAEKALLEAHKDAQTATDASYQPGCVYGVTEQSDKAETVLNEWLATRPRSAEGL